MNAFVVQTRSEGETIELGRSIGRRLRPGAVVLLIGELGSGKTTLAKGIIEGFGAAVPEEVSSPTFTLIHEYGQTRKLYHIDLYRLERAAEAWNLGLDELLDSGAVLLVEWGEKFPELWPASHFEIHLSWLDEKLRQIRLTPELAPASGAGAIKKRGPGPE